METLEIVEHGVVAEVRLQRPEALNALSTLMASEIASACKRLRADAAVRAVVLSGAGERAFCVGADLKERNAMSSEALIAQRGPFRSAFGAVRELPMPTVAAVHGYALGGGCEFALSCDLIVADETAIFALPESSVGLVPGGGGTQLAVRRIGAGRAADLIFTARKVEIAEASAMGLVDRRVPAGSAREAALELAAQIARNSPIALRAAKRAMRDALGELDAGLEREDAAWRSAALSPDRAEGIVAFVEKRAPLWSDASST
jgi:enoyl-CoA hydratase/carnithine racemase